MTISATTIVSLITTTSSQTVLSQAAGLTCTGMVGTISIIIVE